MMSTYKVEKKLKGLKETFSEFTIVEKGIEPETCGGLFYRVAREAWFGSNGDICFRYRFRPLTSKSCIGCYTCEWLLEDFAERLNDYNSGYVDFQLEQYYNHGSLVQLKVTNVSTDWETGIVDDYDIDFVEVNE